MKALSLFQVHQQIRRVMALNFPDAVFIKAEIVRLNVSRGHYYLEIADKEEGEDHLKAKAQAVIWKGTAAALKRKYKDGWEELMQEGIKIAFHARVDFHEVYGLKLIIEDIDLEYTLGTVAMERTQIVERLSKEGLLDQNAALPLPSVLQNIAIISSPTAAGYGDFKEALLNNEAELEFNAQLFPAAMQGLSVENEVIGQIHSIQDRSEEFDAIVIIRGGGGKLDLAFFDNYLIGKAIANCTLPVITGIGHQIDQTVTDLAAHTALKTPTAVAEFLISRNVNFLQSLYELHRQISKKARSILDDESWSLKVLKKDLLNKSKEAISRQKTELQLARKDLRRISLQILANEESALSHFKERTKLLDPKNVLKRGFTAVEQNGIRLSFRDDLERDKSFSIHFSDGKLNIKDFEKDE